MSIISELNRRNVPRAALAYFAGSWLLIQIADAVFPAYDLPDRALTVLITGLIVGFLPAMVISWAFEFTSRGLVRDTGLEAGVASGSTRGIDRAIIVVLALAVGYFALDKFVLSSTSDITSASVAGSRSIAVLAFEDNSPEGDYEFLAEGIAEDILGLLAQVPDLRVSARTSSFSFKDKVVTISDIGNRLNVAAVLEGSISRSSNNLRVNVSLTDVDSQLVVWSQTYNRMIESVFDIQDDIASSVLFELEATLVGNSPTLARVNPAAYTLYLQARRLNHLSNPVDSAAAIPLLEQAIEIESRYALAMAELARANFVVGVRQNASPEENRPIWQECIDLIDRAIAIDPTNPFIVAWQAWIEIGYHGDVETGLSRIDRALELGPNNYDAMRLAILIYGSHGFYERAIALSERLIPRDPYCVVCQFMATISYAAKGRIDEARPGVEYLLSAAPEGLFLATARLLMGVMHLVDENPDQALKLMESGALDPRYKSLISVLALYDLGRYEEADDMFAAATAVWTAEDSRWPIGPAAVSAWTGDHDTAFAWLEQDIEEFDHRQSWRDSVALVFLRPLQSDPRWEDVLARVDGLHTAALADPDSLNERKLEKER